MPQLRIDPEFQSKIPPLTEAEFKQLEANILEAGKVYEPIAVWNGTIVDGHNRYKVVLEHPEIEWTVREMEFADKWAAFDWMYKNQLGRRNLTSEQKTYLLGKLYEARKKTVGNPGARNPDGTYQRRQNGAVGGRVREQIMQEQHVGQKTVERAETYAKGIDAIREADPEFADEILTSRKKIKKTDIMAVGRAKPDKKPLAIERIKTGGPVGLTSEDIKEIESIVNSMADDNVMEFSIENLAEQIKVNAEMYVRALSNLLMDHSDLCNEDPQFIVRAIDEHLTKQIDKIKERLNDGTHL